MAPPGITSTDARLAILEYQLGDYKSVRGRHISRSTARAISKLKSTIAKERLRSKNLVRALNQAKAGLANMSNELEDVKKAMSMQARTHEAEQHELQLALESAVSMLKQERKRVKPVRRDSGYATQQRENPKPGTARHAAHHVFDEEDLSSATLSVEEDHNNVPLH